MTGSCNECKWFKFYPGGRWDPDDAECTCSCAPNEGFEDMSDEEMDERFEKAWEEGEWQYDEQDRPLCPWFTYNPYDPYDD